MMILVNQKKVYQGAIRSEEEAAKLYDSVAILTQGLNAKTNYSYSTKMVKQILRDYVDMNL